MRFIFLFFALVACEQVEKNKDKIIDVVEEVAEQVVEDATGERYNIEIEAQKVSEK